MDLLNALVAFANFVFIPAVAYGAQLALGALGVTLIYGILRFSNFAHGDTMAFGTALTILITFAMQAAGISFGPLPTALLALPFGILLTGVFLVGTDRMVYRFYRKQRAAPVILTMVSLGVMFVMNGVVRFIIGVDDVTFADGERFVIAARDFRDMTGLDEGLAIRTTQVITLVVAAIAVALLFWFLNKTRTGKSMRAFADNEDLALLSGINPERVVQVTWLLVAALATTAGVLYGLDKSFKAFTYFQLLLPIFASAVVGGLGNPLGAIAGGFVIAFSEVGVTYAWKKVAGYALPESLAPDGLAQLLSTDYKFAVSFAILILVLLFMPTGLFKGEIGLMRNVVLFGIMAGLFVITGFTQSWNTSLSILNMAVISAIMAMGVNLQWGYAGLFNIGVMGFVALGGLGVVLTASAPNTAAWQAGGWAILGGLAIGIGAIALSVQVYRRMAKGRMRALAMIALAIAGFLAFRAVFDGGVAAVEAVNPTIAGNIGGLGLPVIVAWPVGGLLAAVAAWAIGKTALGLRSDYLAIATLGIAEIVLSVLRNEDWLARGVKNVIGLPRPVPYEVNLQRDADFIAWAAKYGFDPVTASSIVVKLCYLGLFGLVLAAVVLLSELALKSPWGRMMRAIRDNEIAAGAMGKNVTKRHLQIFVIGSAVIGIAGAMMTTLDGQLTPGTYQPLRFTFLVWVMVIVGGSGNNWGAMLGGFLIWWLWVMVEPIGAFVLGAATSGLPADSWLSAHLADATAHMRLLTMGVILLLVLRFSPRGLIPETKAR